jgi:excisionase family DNA binding protein
MQNEQAQPETIAAYTVTEAARALRISPRTVARLVASREISSVRIGRCRRIRQEALREYLQAVETIRR